MPFAVEICEERDRLMYTSVHEGNRSWCWDMQVNPRQYRCVTIKEDEEGHISIEPSNPEPRWIKINKEDGTFPNNPVKIHQRPDNVEVYLAKVNYKPTKTAEAVAAAGAVARWMYVPPVALVAGAVAGKQISEDLEYYSGVWRENEELHREKIPGRFRPDIDQFVTVDLLLAKEYAWVNAQRGNIILPNAVKTTLLSEERYVGRVGGGKVCAVSITDGMIDYFIDINSTKTTSGEILLLTVDPSV